MEVERKEKKEPAPEDTDIDSSSQSDDDDHQETEIYKDYDLYLAAKNGSLGDFSSVLHRITSAEHTPTDAVFSRLSPSRNTFLHIAAKHGNVDVAAFVAAESPPQMLCKNSMGRTALHVAARAGNESIVKTLVAINRDSVVPNGTETGNLLRIENKKHNTAVHEALIHGWESIATYLIEQDPDVAFCVNKDRESVLYLAAKAGFASCVSLIVGLATGQERLKLLMNGTSPIGIAVWIKNRDVLDAMSNGIPSTVQLRDGEWRTPLHYAALHGWVEYARFLLEKHAVSANQNDKKGYFPIHLASIGGHVDILSLLLQVSPEPEELLDRSGGNILHLAAEYGRDNVVTYILNNPDLRELINMKDKAGNTPLHRATENWHHVVHLTWVVLRAAGTPRSHNSPPQWKKSGSPNNFRERVNTLLLVSTLIITVTFAAGFTVPGGYNNSSTEMGTAILQRHKLFHLFVLSDSIALYSSFAAAIALIWAQFGDTTLALDVLALVHTLIGLALAMMSAAFFAGVTLAVKNVSWLVFTLLVVSITFLAIILVFVHPLCIPNTPRNWRLLYICSYPSYWLMLATSNKSKDQFE